MTEDQKTFQEAENNLKERTPEKPERKFPLRLVFLSVLGICFIIVAVDFVLRETAPVAPSYEVIESDSVTITQSALMLRDYVAANSSLPEGFLELTRQDENIVFTINSDGSFTYEESGIAWTSEPGLLETGGSQ